MGTITQIAKDTVTAFYGILIPMTRNHSNQLECLCDQLKMANFKNSALTSAVNQNFRLINMNINRFTILIIVLLIQESCINCPYQILFFDTFQELILEQLITLKLRLAMQINCIFSYHEPSVKEN